jgi:high-affinity iron transporter
MPFQLSEAQERGKSVYETTCWSCHGSSGRGDGPAVLAGTVAAPSDLTATRLSEAAVRRIQADFQAQAANPQRGQPHMQNVMSIVDAEAFADALNYLPALTYPPEIPGSAIAGRETYVLRCQGCHGAGGRGDGPGSEILELQPADFTQDTLLAARNFEAAFQKVRNGGAVHGSSMPAWGVMLSDGDVWDLVSYIGSFQGGVLSPPPSG